MLDIGPLLMPALYRRRLAQGGPGAWDAEVLALVDRRQAVVFLVTGTAALVAITVLMVFKPG